MLISKLVSVIIPCFNAERWIAEAIDSCLRQCYPFIEIIVIDDGSTDKSLDIIKSYGNRVIVETTANQGGNSARNRGFALSSGEYIQFLDADDYILTEKIQRQVDFLETTGADIVYGDWRHQRHLPSGKIILEDINIAEEQPDILESLLANWWVALSCLLFKREVIKRIDGWDENLKAGQDRDFFLSLVMTGAKVIYQPGCYSVYRRYGNVTVSTSCKIRYLESHYLIVKRTEQRLLEQGLMSMNYRRALALSYFEIARDYQKINKQIYLKLLEKVLDLYPDFQGSNRHGKIYRWVRKIFGFRQTERLYNLTRQFFSGASRKCG